MNHFFKLFGGSRFAVLSAIAVFSLMPVVNIIGCDKGGGGLPREAENTAFCTDADGDGFYVEDDCGTRIDPDDSDPSIYPGAEEVCNDGVDNNVNGFIDEGCGPGCRDADNDGYYDRDGCVTPVDCDDFDATIHPGAGEVCADDVDNDCDGYIDEGCIPETCGDGLDNDGDGFTDEECEPGASKVPDTGQTICYDEDGRIFPCPNPGQYFYGQDASYPNAGSSYTKLDSNGNELSDDALDWDMVRDNITGLIWEVKTDDDGIRDKDFKYNWSNAGSRFSGFISALNSSRFGGYSDWRLPTVKELAYIVDYGTYGPAINLYYFPNTMYYEYWTATSNAEDNELAWYLDFYDGRPASKKKEELFYVRAVRGSTPAQTFTDNGNNTVTDNSTGLMWMKITADSMMTWKDALEYCEKISFAGYDDWRLPNVKEFRSLIDYSRYTPAIDWNYFPNTNNSTYWTSTTYHGDRTKAWVVGLSNGGGGGTTKTNLSLVRAVRNN